MRLRHAPFLILFLSAPLAAQSQSSAQSSSSVRVSQNTIRQLDAVGKDLVSLSETHERYEVAAREIAEQRDRLGKMVAAVAATERGRTKEMDALVAELARMNDRFAGLQKATQNESRRFQTLSNASKARHEAAMGAVRNVK